MKGDKQQLCFYIILTYFIYGIAFTYAEDIPLTILHTNDVHSHYRPHQGPFNLGGIGRLATAIRRVRSRVKNSLLLDGGDWSEGHIYYNLGAGRTAVEMLNALGYDAAVIGNHDWLNGPDHLIKLFKEVPPTFFTLAANINTHPEKYQRAYEFESYVQPYQIIRVGKLKIALIGVVTFEFIYDKFFSPIEIIYPFDIVRNLAKKLKEQADLVVVISHNGLDMNKALAALPGVDIVIHAHDHLKFPEPLVIQHRGKTSLLVEAGYWGFYLGRLDLTIHTETKNFDLNHYELIQIDRSIPEDPRIATLVNHYDRQIIQKYGDVFQDAIAETTIDIRGGHPESLYGHLLTDAYREATGAEIAFEQLKLTSGELYRGVLSTSHIYNALTQVYNPLTEKSWTLTTMKMSGDTLNWLLNLIIGISPILPGGVLSTSGLHAVYDPVDISLPIQGKALQQIEVNGEPINPSRYYKVAFPQGLVEAFEFMEKHWFRGRKIPRIEQTNTEIEDWRALASYLKNHSPITPAKISRVGRIVVLRADLALYHDEIELRRNGEHLQARVVVRNLGSTRSSPRKLSFSYDKTPFYTVDDPNPAKSDRTFDLPSIEPGEQQTINVDLTLPEQLSQTAVPVYFKLNSSQDDQISVNDGTWLMAEADR